MALAIGIHIFYNGISVDIGLLGMTYKQLDVCACVSPCSSLFRTQCFMHNHTQLFTDLLPDKLHGIESNHGRA